MFYIYRSPTLNNIVHVTTDKDLYSDGYLEEIFQTKGFVEIYAKEVNKEICWCDENPIPHSLS